MCITRFKYVSLLCLVLMGCSHYLADSNYSIRDEAIHVNSVYLHDNCTGLLLKKQTDPFSISALSEAKQSLINDYNLYSLTKAEVDGLSSYEVKATHCALTIFPKSNREVAQIEGTEGVKIAYYPFNYSIVGGYDSNNPEQYDSYIAERNPHKMKYENVCSSECDSIIPVVYEDLPVLYAVWPVEHEIPDTLDYRIDYEVCLPNKSVEHNNYYSLIKKEAIRKALNRSIETKTMNEPDDSASYKGLGGYIKCFDSHTNTYQGIGGLSVRAQFGSYIQYSETTSDGYFYLLAEIPDFSSFYCVFSKIWHWVIRLNNATSSYQYSFGSVNSVLGDGVQYNFNLELFPSSPYIVNSVQRAVAFYYKNILHDVIPAKFSSELIIRAFDSYSSGDSYGVTTVSSNADPYVRINNYSSNCAYIIGTTFHELGHVTMFKDKGGYTDYISTIRFIRESFACYIGWHLSSCFYSYLGETVTDSLSFINPQKHQTWTSSQGSYGKYSPLFVDLCDAYNQSSNSSNYLNDDISGATYPFIRELEVLSTTWDSCKSRLSAYADSCNTQSQMSQFISGFETWFNNNPSELNHY